MRLHILVLQVVHEVELAEDPGAQQSALRGADQTLAAGGARRIGRVVDDGLDRHPAQGATVARQREQGQCQQLLVGGRKEDEIGSMAGDRLEHVRAQLAAKRQAASLREGHAGVEADVAQPGQRSELSSKQLG